MCLGPWRYEEWCGVVARDTTDMAVLKEIDCALNLRKKQSKGVCNTGFPLAKVTVNACYFHYLTLYW